MPLFWIYHFNEGLSSGVIVNFNIKLFEQVVFTQLYEYVNKNNLLYSSQYGFHKNTLQKWRVWNWLINIKINR